MKVKTETWCKQPPPNKKNYLGVFYPYTILLGLKCPTFLKVQQLGKTVQYKHKPKYFQTSSYEYISRFGNYKPNNNNNIHSEKCTKENDLFYNKT